MVSPFESKGWTIPPEEARDGIQLSFSLDESRESIQVDLLGNKGARLAEMKRLGFPVPPGFILTTDSWQAFVENESVLPESVWQETLGQVVSLEGKTGLKFGDHTPLVVSVRSGAPHSLPGVLQTITHVGLNDETVLGLVEKVGEWAAWDSYRRGIESFGTGVLEIDPQQFISCLTSLRNTHQVSSNQELPVQALQETTQKYKDIIRQNCGSDFPQDACIQLHLAIAAVFRSWDNPSALAYRQNEGLVDEEGTAVTIQEMVFGNRLEEPSGSGVYFTCDPYSGDHNPQVAYGSGVPGSEIVGDEATHQLVSTQVLPVDFREKLTMYGRILEEFFGCPQEIEFVVEKGKLWLLQTRDARLTPPAIIATLKESVDAGIMGITEATRRLTAPQIEALLTPGLDPDEVEKAISEGRLLGRNLIPISFGIAQGQVATSLERAQELASSSIPVILVLEKLTTDELARLPDNVRGVILARGAAGSHIGQLLKGTRRGQGVPALSGSEINSLLTLGEEITIDTHEGLVFRGRIPSAQEPSLSSEALSFLRKCQEILHKNPWLAACYPVEGVYQRVIFEEKIRRTLRELQQRWQSPKAWAIGLIAELLPSLFRENYWIFDPRDTDSLRAYLASALDEDSEASVRTCHNPQRLATAPWQRISRKEEIDPFLQDVLPLWRGDPTLTEVLIGQFPRGKLDPDLAREHCVFTVSCQGGHVFIQIRPHSAQLRDLEEANPKDLITVTADINSKAPLGLGQITAQFGEDLQNDPQSKGFADLVMQTVFEKWWEPPFTLPHLMTALTLVGGLTAIDGQARLYPDGRRWCKVYDMKSKEG